MQIADRWKEFVISVPRPISPGYMVGMQDEVRDGRHYIVEFLESVPEYQPNPIQRTQAVCTVQPAAGNECSDEDVLVAWSREKGFTIIDRKSVEGR